MAYISPHFSYAEVTTTSTGLSNHPSLGDLETVRILAWAILEPLRTLVGPLRVNSWYRSPAVNSHPSVKGSSSSDHLHGGAADVRPTTMSVPVAWRKLLAIAPILPVDQAILYPASVYGDGHDRIHIGMRSGPGQRPRRQTLVSLGPGRYVEWGNFDSSKL